MGRVSLFHLLNNPCIIWGRPLFLLTRNANDSHRWQPDKKEWIKTPEKIAQEEEEKRKKEEEEKQKEEEEKNKQDGEEKKD